MSVLHQSSRHCVRLSSMPLMLALMLTLTLPLLLPATLMYAQAAPPADTDLIVLVCNGMGTGLPGLAVVVRDAGGQQVLTRATTDAGGRALFGHLIVSDVRVAVSGTLPGGRALTQRGNDAQGIPILIGAPPTTVILRVGADGLVAPDPTLFSPERGAIPILGTPITQVDLATADAPTAPHSGTGNEPALPQVALPQVGAPPAAEAPAPGVIARVPTANASGWPWGMLVLVGLGALGVAGIVVYLRDQGGR